MTTPRTVLLTGFEPFEDAAINESWEAVQAAHALLRAAPEPCEVTIRRLPVVFDAAADELLEAVRLLRPSLVLAVGLAGGRTAVTPERVAINVQDARIPDNSGAQPVDVPCVEGGPDGLFTTAPIKAMTLAGRETGAPVEVSQTAGTFVCNDVFYRLQHALATDPSLAGIRGGFVHVPLTDQVAPDLAGRALATMVERALRTEHDVRLSAGRED